MSKNKSNKNKKAIQKSKIEEIKVSRTGGQIALEGYSYQLLYSCYTILNENNYNTRFLLEGIEDIDLIREIDGDERELHIQLKHSIQKQDASYMKSILKNFFEIYLIDDKREFRLTYDFPVSKGNFSKLIDGDLSKENLQYWKSICAQIKLENSSWVWKGFSFENFIKNLSFERLTKDELTEFIECKLIENYNITIDNLTIYMNAIKVLCLDKMKSRGEITKKDVDDLIENVKDDISKGYQNPAHNWISRLKFETNNDINDLSYFEGKKATESDIVNNLPVRRISIENKVTNEINNNRVVIIKSSSGQGKTTIALQVAFNMINEYNVYQLNWCNDEKEIEHIINFFRTRVRLGEKPLILLDNLDFELSKWNKLAEKLQNEVNYHYKILITTREEDWYNYSGKLENVKSLSIVDIELNEDEAEQIFNSLDRLGKIDNSIKSWHEAWYKVSDRKLLIEYVYLLTHGQMLAERISEQIKKIGNSETGDAKCELMRIVCFADISGIKLEVKSVISSLRGITTRNFDEIIKSIEQEYLIKVDNDGKYFEGLHPVRSKHIIERLHEYTDLGDTAIKVISITNKKYISKMFSSIPFFGIGSQDFYNRVVNVMLGANDFSLFKEALLGVFSGSVNNYFNVNKEIFDVANRKGALFLFSVELSPFTKIEEHDYQLSTIDNLKVNVKDNAHMKANIDYLSDLRDGTNKLDFKETDLFIFSKSLHSVIVLKKMFDVTQDIDSYGFVSYWLYNIDKTFNVSSTIELDKVLEKAEFFDIKTIANLMYVCFCGNKKYYLDFIEDNLDKILCILEYKTKSTRIYINETEDSINIEYLLLPSKFARANDESVDRIDIVCRSLPIYSKYCTVGIRPEIEMIKQFHIIDDSIRNMPIENVILTFRQEFNSIWQDTIYSNYEASSLYEWLEYWFEMRKDIVTQCRNFTKLMVLLLSNKNFNSVANGVDSMRVKLHNKLITEYRSPYANRPFEEKSNLYNEFGKVKGYFQVFNSVNFQIGSFLKNEQNMQNILMFNLKDVLSKLDDMQKFFDRICVEQSNFLDVHNELCKVEGKYLDVLEKTCFYFIKNKPSKYVDSNFIEKYYKDKQNETLDFAKKTLKTLNEEFDVIFPIAYIDETLSYYPIIIKNLNFYNEEMAGIVAFLCTDFLNTDFQYLAIFSQNNSGVVSHTGLKLNRAFLEKIKNILEGGCEVNTNGFDIANHYPVIFDNRMRDCFKEEMIVENEMVINTTNQEKILELLWAYSYYRDVINENYNEEYLNYTLTELKKDILIELSTSSEWEHEVLNGKYLSDLCNRVFSGELFGDSDINYIYNELREYIVKNNSKSY